jgi:excisionase family DNA binding protein
VLTNFVTIKEAAKMLGVTPLTLRNWDNSGKLPTTRHPMSNYRIYKSETLEKFMRDIEAGTVPVRSKPRKLMKRKLVVKHLND